MVLLRVTTGLKLVKDGPAGQMCPLQSLALALRSKMSSFAP